MMNDQNRDVYTNLPTKTWQDVEEAALHDPFLHQLVTLDRMRECGQSDATREQLLITVVLGLAKAYGDLQKREVQRLMTEPTRPFGMRE